MLDQSQGLEQFQKPAGFEALLLSLHVVGNELKDSESVMERVWGEHLLEDWKTLTLFRERFVERGL